MNVWAASKMRASSLNASCGVVLLVGETVEDHIESGGSPVLSDVDAMEVTSSRQKLTRLRVIVRNLTRNGKSYPYTFPYWRFWRTAKSRNSRATSSAWKTLTPAKYCRK